MTQKSPIEKLREANEIAQAHGCFIVKRAAMYLVFRKTTIKPTYVGARATPETLRAFVCNVTVAARPQ